VPAFWPFRQIARTLHDDARLRPLLQPWLHSTPDLLRLLPELDAAAPPVSRKTPDAIQRFELCRTFATLLGHISTLHPLVIEVEDVHFADAGSLLILEQLLNVCRQHALGLIVTSRSAALEPGQPVLDALGGAATLTQLTHIALQAFTPDEILMLLERTDSPEVTLTAGRTVHQLSAGNPLFTRQIVQQIGAGRGGVTVQLGETLQEVITRRAERLPERTKQLLKLAAVLGIEAPLDLLAALDHSSAQTVCEALQSAIDAGLMRVHDASPERLVFEHALIRDACYAAIDDTARAALHFEAFEHAQQCDARATHAYLSGGRVPPTQLRKLLVEAAQETFDHLAFDRAVVHLGRAREWFDDTATAAERAGTTLFWAWARWFADDPIDRVMDAFRTAAELARGSDNAELFARAATHCAVGNFSGVHRGMVTRELDDLDRLVEAERRLAPHAREMRLLVARALAWMYACLGNYEAVTVHARTALELAPDPPDLHTYFLDPQLRLAAEDHLPPRLQAFEAQLDFDYPERTASSRAENALNLADIFMTFGEMRRFGRAVAMLEQALREWTVEPRGGRLGARYALFMLLRSCLHVVDAVRRGALAEAERRLAATFAEDERLQPLRGERPDRYALLVLAFQVFWYRGHASAMEPLLDSHLEEHPQDVWLASLFRAHCALERRELRAAREHFAALRATGFLRPVAGRQSGLRIEARIRVADLCVPLGTREDAALLYERMSIRPHTCGGENYVHWGSVSRPLAELALKLGKPDLAHRHALDALAMNTRIEHRPEQVRTRTALAHALRALGREAEAHAQLGLARDEARAIGMASSFAELARLDTLAAVSGA
jgi:tetratricopeptide (TPR) repeat protein